MNTYYELTGEVCVGDDSYTGYHWEKCRGSGTLDEMLDLAQHWAEHNGRAKSEWDHKDPKWRGTYTPAYRKIKLCRIESHHVELDLRQAELEGYQKKLGEVEKKRAEYHAEKEAQDRAEYERLQAKYKEA